MSQSFLFQAPSDDDEDNLFDDSDSITVKHKHKKQIVVEEDDDDEEEDLELLLDDDDDDDENHLQSKKTSFRNPRGGGGESKKKSKTDIRDIEETYVPCMLPEDKTIESKRHDKYEVEGLLDEFYRCQICRIGDSNRSEHTTKGIAKFFDLYDTFYKWKTDSILFERMADTWNELVYKINLKLDPNNSLSIQRITETKVEYHFRHCSPNDFKNNIWADIDFMILVQNHIRRSSIFSSIPDENTSTKVDPKMVDKWLNIHTKKLIAFNSMKKTNSAVIDSKTNNKRKRP